MALASVVALAAATPVQATGPGDLLLTRDDLPAGFALYQFPMPAAQPATAAPAASEGDGTPFCGATLRPGERGNAAIVYSDPDRAVIVSQMMHAYAVEPEGVLDDLRAAWQDCAWQQPPVGGASLRTELHEQPAPAVGEQAVAFRQVTTRVSTLVNGPPPQTVSEIVMVYIRQGTWVSSLSFVALPPNGVIPPGGLIPPDDLIDAVTQRAAERMAATSSQ